MKAVEHQTDSRMIRPPDDLPGIAVVIDVPPPCQRLEGDAETPLGSAVAKLVEIGCGPVDAAKRIGRHIAAHHQ